MHWLHRCDSGLLRVAIACAVLNCEFVGCNAPLHLDLCRHHTDYYRWFSNWDLVEIVARAAVAMSFQLRFSSHGQQSMNMQSIIAFCFLSCMQICLSMSV